MPSDPKPPSPEREQTDESLRVEREKADDALGDGPSVIDETADAVITKARARADAVLAAARAKVVLPAPGVATARKSVLAERSSWSRAASCHGRSRMDLAIHRVTIRQDNPGHGCVVSLAGCAMAESIVERDGASGERTTAGP